MYVCVVQNLSAQEKTNCADCPKVQLYTFFSFFLTPSLTSLFLAPLPLSPPPLSSSLSLPQCDRTQSLDMFHEAVRKRKGETFVQNIAIIGAGCSVATLPVAEICHYYNLPMVRDEGARYQRKSKRGERSVKRGGREKRRGKGEVIYIDWGGRVI